MNWKQLKCKFSYMGHCKHATGKHRVKDFSKVSIIQHNESQDEEICCKCGYTAWYY